MGVPHSGQGMGLGMGGILNLYPHGQIISLPSETPSLREKEAKPLYFSWSQVNCPAFSVDPGGAFQNRSPFCPAP